MQHTPLKHMATSLPSPAKAKQQQANTREVSSRLTKRSKPVTVLDIRQAGSDHQVVSVCGGRGSYRKTPCPPCPWVRENAGEFLREAFVISAGTAYDMSDRKFACHESGATRPATCAGFLLRGADHNLAVRLARLQGETFDDVHDDGLELFDSYREMAEANGVSPSDPALKHCR